MKKRFFLKTTAIAALAGLALTGVAYAANPVLKIGFVGVTSGPAASWGISNQRSMETRAAWINELGGVKIGGTTYDVKIVAFDDQKDPKRAIAGMEKMAQEGIHYVVGPNVDDGAAAVRPVASATPITPNWASVGKPMSGASCAVAWKRIRPAPRRVLPTWRRCA